jgi:hypothetical protein
LPSRRSAASRSKSMPAIPRVDIVAHSLLNFSCLTSSKMRRRRSAIGLDFGRLPGLPGGYRPRLSLGMLSPSPIRFRYLLNPTGMALARVLL